MPMDAAGERAPISTLTRCLLNHVLLGLLYQRPEFRMAVLPELGESRVVLARLLPLALTLVDLSQPKMGWCSALEELAESAEF